MDSKALERVFKITARSESVVIVRGFWNRRDTNELVNTRNSWRVEVDKTPEVGTIAVADKTLDEAINKWLARYDAALVSLAAEAARKIERLTALQNEQS